MNYEYKTKEYKNHSLADRDMNKMQTEGWEVVSLNDKNKGWGCLRVGCLGILFLPLALLGHKGHSVVVTYKRSIK
jgi:hypothetical protein